MKNTSTICAIATPGGYGGVGIIRISGPDALTYSSAVFEIKRYSSPLKNSTEPRRAYYGVAKIDDEMIDDGLLIYFQAPNSFTGEDVVELQLHGSPTVLTEIVSELTRMGCELARNGEFSYRAFMNGKVDLSQAEEISNLIYSKSARSAKAIYQNLAGGVSENVKQLHNKLVQLLAEYSVNIDYYDEDLPEILHQSKLSVLEDAENELSRLISSFRYGDILNSGATVVLAGYPNAGKSSLFNYLLNRERAIVSEVPGTTRDSLEAFLDIGGIPVKLVDTAGIRQSSDKIEAMGIARSLKELKSADTVIWLTEQGQRIDLELLNEFEIDTGKILYVQSKSDDRTTGATGSNMDEIKISTETGAGVDTLIARLKELLISEDAPDNVITTVRQKDLLEKTTSHISTTIRIIENNPEHFELITEELACAVEYLDEFLGLSRRTDVLDTVFKNFCVGK